MDLTVRKVNDEYEVMGLMQATWSDMVEKKLFDKIFEIEDPVNRATAILSVRDRCGELGKKEDFKSIVAAYKQREKAKKRVKVANGEESNCTAFDVEGTDYKNLSCGKWIADECGVWTPSTDPLVNNWACKHPILIAGRFRNIQTDEERIKLAYKRNGLWREIIVSKSIIAASNKIVQLSDFGVLVTSENARYLVKYLSDMEADSERDISITESTTKLGWHNDKFIPFDMDGIEFDGAKQFGHIYTSITRKGSRNKWMESVKAIRKRGRIETKIMIAASLAAPLIEKLGILPFFVDLYGMTEGGKTVALMLAASIWANPDGGNYIGDFMCTDTNLEVKADMLNNLPMLLDDSAKSDKRITDNFEAVIYNLCSGRGKGRSNRELGLNRTYTWKTVFICNGENPLTDHMGKGGALNRIVEVPAQDHIFEDPAKSAETFKVNYGWIGPEYVEILKDIPIEELKEEFDEIVKSLEDPSKMQKQTQSMACMMLADRIAERYLFKDGVLISESEAKDLIVDLSQVSDNQRCYEYICGLVQANGYRFQEPDADHAANFERWGILQPKKNEVGFLPTILLRTCKDAGFSKDSFIAWADKHGLIDKGKSGKTTRTARMPGMDGVTRMVFIKLPDVKEEDDDSDFMGVTDEEVPFK